MLLNIASPRESLEYIYRLFATFYLPSKDSDLEDLGECKSRLGS